MSTNSTIAIQNPDDTVDSIYCHYDGTLKQVGKKLLEYYTTSDLVRELISLGDISALGINLESTDDYVTRGEEWDMIKPVLNQPWELYLQRQQEFNYIFMENQHWFFRKSNQEDFELLTEEKISTLYTI